MLIPKDNWQGSFARLSGIKVIPVETIEQVLKHSLQLDGKLADIHAAPERLANTNVPLLHARTNVMDTP